MCPRMPRIWLSLLMLRVDEFFTVNEKNCYLAVSDSSTKGVKRITSAATGHDSWTIFEPCFCNERRKSFAASCF